MNTENIHRLLRRQINKAKLSNEQIEALTPLFASIDDAYKSFDKDIKHLENVLEVNSNELFKANQQLKNDNILKTEEVNKVKTSLNKVVNNVTDIIIELDSNGNFTYLNKAWEKFAEEPVEQSLGKNYLEFTPQIKTFDLSINEKILNKDFDKFKTVFSRTNKCGKLKWWELSSKMIKSEHGEIQGVIASLIDVTSLKETEKELINANSSKSRFLSTMSHEIRTPLNAVIAISNILLMEDPKPEQLENLRTLKYSSKHLLHLINDILDYNKLVSGKLILDNSPFDLINTITQTMTTMSFNAKEKGLNLKFNVDKNVPHYVKGDSHRLSQVLTNLLSNSIKFTQKGGITLNLSCIEKNDKKAIINFKVTDTGIGIDEDKLDIIFDRFTQAETDTTKKFGGTGLGLAICKKIINLQNSKIHVTSKLGAGSTFAFDLEFEIDKKNDSEAPTNLDISELSLEGVKLLIVDDNEINLMVLKQFLNKWNIEYEEARNGVEAFEKLKNEKFDLVLLDLQMPIMDGFTVAQEVRKLDSAYFKNLPIIALSASVSSDITDKVINSGMNDYLCKPFEPEVLFQKIKWYCNKKSLVTIS